MVLDPELFWTYLELYFKIICIYLPFISHNGDEIVFFIIYFFSLWVIAHLVFMCSQVIVSEAKIILVDEQLLDFKDWLLNTMINWLTEQMKSFKFFFYDRNIKKEIIRIHF